VADDPSPVEGLSYAALIRETGIVLAAITGILYVASWLYSTMYLREFGVPVGFGGLGLGPLAMLDWFDYLLIVATVSVLYKTVFTAKTLEYVVGVLCFALVASSGTLVKLAYSGAIDVASPAVVGCAAVVAFVTMRAYRRIRELIGKLQTQLEKAESILKDAASLDAEKQKEAERIKSTCISEIRRSKRYIWMFCSIITVSSVIPMVAKLEATRLSKPAHWIRLDPTSEPRIPVYWVGDRVVYLTVEKGCSVHMMIGKDEVARTECPDLIEDVVRK
jgi:hypothetical protein